MAGGTGSSSYTTGVWNGWITSSTSATTDTIWVSWASTGTSTSSGAWREISCSAPLSEDQVRALKVRQEELQAEAAAQAKKASDERQAAESRAEILMKEVLSEAEFDEYVKKAQITLITKGAKYCIHKLRTYNIDRLDETGKVVEKLCVVPDNRDIPIQDHMLAQYLSLRLNQEGTLRRANHRPIYPPG
jgi:hypothetical protein